MGASRVYNVLAARMHRALRRKERPLLETARRATAERERAARLRPVIEEG